MQHQEFLEGAITVDGLFRLKKAVIFSLALASPHISKDVIEGIGSGKIVTQEDGLILPFELGASS